MPEGELMALDILVSVKYRLSGDINVHGNSFNLISQEMKLTLS
jgi:hypothetical protein